MVEAKVDADKKVLFIVILIVLIAGIFSTYSYFTSKSNSEEQNISTGTLSLEFDDDNPMINASNIFPIDEKDIFDMATQKSFSIKNTGDANITAKIELTNILIDEELKDENFKWALYEGESKINDGDFSNLTTNSIELVNNVNILTTNPNIVNYTLYIWIQNIDEPQDELQGKTLKANITVDAIQ